MSMKLYVVAATDILKKGYDPSFPYSKLGEDGLLVAPMIELAQPIIPAIPIESNFDTTSLPAEVPVAASEPQEPAQVQFALAAQATDGVPDIREEEHVKTPEVPTVIEDEKKSGKRSKKNS